MGWEKEEREEREEKAYEEKWARDPLGAVFWGLILILAGIFLFAATQGWILWENWWAWLLLGVGVLVIVEGLVRWAMPAYRRPLGGRLFWGAIMIAVGLGGVLGLENWWPLILIAIGVVILVQALVGRTWRP